MATDDPKPKRKLYGSSKKKEKAVAQKPKRGCRGGCTLPFTKPLRALQLIILLILFSLTIYLMSTKNSPLSDIAAMFMIILFALYLFVVALDIISQFGGGAIPDTPWFLFSLLGIILFLLLGFLVHSNVWKISKETVSLVIMVLCFVMALLFLLDFMFILIYWRQTYTKLKKCYPFGEQGQIQQSCEQAALTTLFMRNLPCPRNVDDLGEHNCEMATSVSEYKRLETAEEGTVHAYRKIGVGHRRQYTDTPTCTPSVITVDVAQVQTEPPRKDCVDVESLTVPDDNEESRHRSICRSRSNSKNKSKSKSPEPQPTAEPSEPQISCQNRSNPPQLCPTFLHIMGGGMIPPYYGACTCGGGGGPKPTYANASVSGSNTNLNVEGTNNRPSKKPGRVYETRPCPTHGAGLAARLAGAPDTVTRVTLSQLCVRRNKRTQTPMKQSGSGHNRDSSPDSKTKDAVSVDIDNSKKKLKAESSVEIQKKDEHKDGKGDEKKVVRKDEPKGGSAGGKKDDKKEKKEKAKSGSAVGKKNEGKSAKAAEKKYAKAEEIEDTGAEETTDSKAEESEDAETDEPNKKGKVDDKSSVAIPTQKTGERDSKKTVAIKEIKEDPQNEDRRDVENETRAVSMRSVCVGANVCRRTPTTIIKHMGIQTSETRREQQVEQSAKPAGRKMPTTSPRDPSQKPVEAFNRTGEENETESILSTSDFTPCGWNKSQSTHRSFMKMDNSVEICDDGNNPDMNQLGDRTQMDVYDKKNYLNTYPEADTEMFQHPGMVSGPYKCFYRDIFGRTICGVCATNNTIKIRQKACCQPDKDLKCSKCSRRAHHRTMAYASGTCTRCGQSQAYSAESRENQRRPNEQYERSDLQTRLYQGGPDRKTCGKCKQRQFQTYHVEILPDNQQLDLQPCCEGVQEQTIAKPPQTPSEVSSKSKKETCSRSRSACSQRNKSRTNPQTSSPTAERTDSHNTSVHSDLEPPETPKKRNKSPCSRPKKTSTPPSVESCPKSSKTKRDSSSSSLSSQSKIKKSQHRTCYLA